jgi:uncharacterized protein YgiM (DUF1202 family)
MLHRPYFLLSCILVASSWQVNAADETTAPVFPAPVKTEVLDSRPFTPFTGAVVGAKVRMRTHPSLESHVVKETVNGEMFAVMGEVQEYCAVAPPKGTKGYVFRTYILNDTVEADRVNVRLYPDTDAPVIAQLNTGDRVVTTVCETNSKWLMIDLPSTSRFYIAKEYIERKGSIDLIATIEKKKVEATHHLNASSFFAQSELQKPFEQIDLEKIDSKFLQIAQEYQELPAIKELIHEVLHIFHDIYVEKKVAFLEDKADRGSRSHTIDVSHLEKLAKLGVEVKPTPVVIQDQYPLLPAEAAAQVIGLSCPQSDEHITDKMMTWQPLEESLYHLWAASNHEKEIEEFYAEEARSATVLSGMIEPYTRPVKNRPGDFVLKHDNLTVAFLYSTRVNLEKHVGQKVTVIATPRPNHNFAFPAYYVINVE